MACPPFEDLILLHSGSAEPPGASEHLAAGCAHCARRWQLLDALPGTLAEGDPEPVPGRLRERAVRIHAEARRRRPGRWAEFVCRLRDGLSAPAPTFALRGGEGRHALYAAGPFDLDLSLVEAATLVGQVAPCEEGAPSLRDATCVLSGARGARSVPLERYGDFCFEAVREGTYDLLVQAPSFRLVLPEVRVGGA